MRGRQQLRFKNVYNDGANSLRSYLQYSAAMSSGDLRTAAAILRALNPAPSARAVESPHNAVAVELAEALRSRGLEVQPNLGQSHFRCDLAVRRSGDEAFQLAVFVDTERYYSETDVLEREVLKPALLRSFGWRVEHVLTKDWYEDPETVLGRLQKRLHDDLDAAAPQIASVDLRAELDAMAEAATEPAHLRGSAKSGLVSFSAC